MPSDAISISGTIPSRVTRACRFWRRILKRFMAGEYQQALHSGGCVVGVEEESGVKLLLFIHGSNVLVERSQACQRVSSGNRF